MRARPNPINNLQESRRKVQTILGGKSRVWRFSQHHKQSGGPGRRAAGVHNSGYIVRSAGVRSGNAIVEGTRIAVHDVIGLLQNGETVETMTANCFPQLTRSQVYECLAFYEDHRGEIDLLVARQMARAPE